ncbi:MAG: glycosyltransferase family 4 protein [Anaerolineales bacterium]
MRILTSLYYYRPHFSGLTVYTERLSRSLAARGHDVTILTSRYDRNLASLESMNGVQVRRINVAFTVSKGPLMPTIPYWAMRLIPKHDIVHLHVPQLDAAFFAALAKFFRKPVVLTYHCDLNLPPSPVNWLASQASRFANAVSATLSDVVVTNTRDYAEESRFLRRFLGKLQVIPPPIEVSQVDADIVKDLKSRWNIQDGQQIIGMAARLATEKGAQVLARALPQVLTRWPRARVIYAGQYRNVIGEEAYARRLQPLIDELGEHWLFAGSLSQDELAAFFSLCHLTVLPSLNTTESFGMVQVESIFLGTPVIASDLPGIRQPVKQTGMGRVFPAGDSRALAEAIVDILDSPGKYLCESDVLTQRFGSAHVAEEYEMLFRRLLSSGEDS